MKSFVEAGFGKADITPRLGVELCGYGPFRNRKSERVLDPIQARAMAVRHATGRWVLVSCDFVGVGEPFVEEIRRIVSEQSGWQPNEIMVHATHTHSAPCAIPTLIGWGEPDPLYLEVLPRQVARACLDAIADLDKAAFFHAETVAFGFSYNRELPDPGRTNARVLAGEWVTDRPEETDTTAHVIRVERLNGNLAGFLAYFSCHPVVAGHKNHEIHGDFTGMAISKVEAENPGATGLFLQGAMGDINSNFVHGEAEETLRALEDFSSRFASVINNGLRQAQPLEVNHISAHLTEAPCRLSAPTTDALREALQKHEAIVSQALPSDDDIATRIALIYCQSLRKILAHPPHDKALTAQSLHLGPLSLTGLPMELMHRIKQHFQKERGEMALLLSATNGFRGYAPVKECFENPANYAAYQVPYMLGTLPYTSEIANEALTAALKAHAAATP